MGRRGLALWIGCAGWLLAAQVGAASAEDECGVCHGEVEVAPEPHGAFGCTSCHAGIDVSEHPGEPVAPPGDALCGTCHDVADALPRSVHSGLGCSDCHGAAHGIRPASESSSRISPRGQLEACGACHAGAPLESFRSGVHGRGLVAAGLPGAASCSSCHGSHGIRPVGDPDSPMSHRRAPETCGSCHRYLLEGWIDESRHGLAWKAGRSDGPVCISCHASHGVAQPTRPEARLRLPERCGGCHAEALGTYRDGFHGRFTDLGFFTAAVCSDCHTPHNNLPAADPRSSVHPDHVEATCGRCHESANASLASFDPHADPTRPTRHPAVHGTWLFMTGLLIAVFGFFAVHDLLWLQRSLVGLLRGEFSRGRHPQGPWIRRFRRSHVWLHAVVVLTFLTLAVTGLPLKFHDSEWARRLASLLGGVGVTRSLHRVAAIATLGYASFHLVQLLVAALVRRQPGLFWGPDSLVPQPRDLRDLWQHLLYFLYLAPRPRLDRWTYWEKFDYFAVFWGVVMIGASGLMLWLPGLVTAFLPGWTLNVAFVVHSDEALLAVGFIFIFHFFHTHLRPEAFPLDPAIFVDRVPLERFREERPLEYERLQRSGALEGRLTDPPTPGQLLAGRIFGFSALATGLVLALAMLGTFAGSLLGS